MIARLIPVVFTLILALCFRVVIANEQGWYPYDIDQDRLSGPVDFSYLNHKIGERDWIGTDGSSFTVYDDRARESTSRPIRFFGVNIGFDAAFPSADEARQLADRLARLGVNLVRLHPLDLVLRSEGADRVGGVLTTAPYPTLDPEAIARLRALIDALKERGIYVDLSIHSGYTFRAVDGVYTGGAEFAASKPLNGIFPNIINLQVKFAESLISSLNLGNDPALAFVEINNEGSSVHSWEKGKIDDSAKDPVGDELRSRKNELFGENGPPQSFDLYMSLDRQYFERVRLAIRSVAPRVLIIGTQMDFGGLANYTSDQNADYRDAHFYIDHYDFPSGLWNWEDWRQRDTSMIGSGLSELMRVSLLRDLTKPFMISEFNEPWPNSHGLEILPITASFACLQDWGGLVFYDYAHHAFSEEPNFPHEFSLSGDLSKLAVFGISAAIFRQGLVSPGRDTVVIPIPPSVREAATKVGANGNVLSFFERRGELNKTDILQHKIGLDPSGYQIAKDFRQTRSSGAGPVQADNGQLRYWSNSLYVIDAPRVAGYVGFLPPDKSVSTKSTTLTSLSTDAAFRSVIALSLDGKAIHESGHLLISVTAATARSSPDGSVLTMKPYNGQRGWWTVKGTDGSSPSDKLPAGRTPTWMQRTPLSFTLKTVFSAVKVYALDGTGKRLSKLAPENVIRESDGIRILIQPDANATASLWYEIQAIR
jgi:hypothetical protein